MYYRWTFMPVSKDRRRPLSLIASRGVADYSKMDIYTFGVYTGASLKFWFDGFDALKISTGPHWGFDSFEGLPEETEGMALECAAWKPGSFSAADQFGVYSFREVEQKILDHVGPQHADQTKLIKGFFSDSLTETLKEERGMQPALLIDVDVDLYVSCIQCMDWMFRHGLIVPGTVVYYDDVSIVKADAGGELKAHEELTEKYQVTWRKLHDSCWEVVDVAATSAPPPPLRLHPRRASWRPRRQRRRDRVAERLTARVHAGQPADRPLGKASPGQLHVGCVRRNEHCGCVWLSRGGAADARGWTQRDGHSRGVLPEGHMRCAPRTGMWWSVRSVCCGLLECGCVWDWRGVGQPPGPVLPAQRREAPGLGPEGGRGAPRAD